MVAGIVTALFALTSQNAVALKTFPNDCTASGGTVKNGVCYFGDGTQTSSNVVLKVNDEWVLSEGDMTISGGWRSSVGIANNALGEASSITNKGLGVLTITGGTGSSTEGMSSNAAGEGSDGSIINAGAGTLNILGGMGGYAHGLENNATDGGIGTIVNRGEGSLTIRGGNGVISAYGISTNSYGKDSVGTILNEGAGTLTILGSAVTNGASGIQFFALSGGTGALTNSGRGTLIVSGGGESKNGIYYNASRSDSTSTISNTGTGTLIIKGGSGNVADGIGYNAFEGGSGGVRYNAYGPRSVGEILNEGTGTITIKSSDAANTSGIDVFATHDGTGRLINSGAGSIEILGGAGKSSHGIHDFASTSLKAYNGATALMQNASSGTILIQGGSGEGAHGMSTFGWNYEDGQYHVNANLVNEGTGVITIQGGDGLGAYGLAWAFAGNTKGKFTNGVDATFNLLGTENAAAIGGFSYTTAEASFDNAGTLNLNAYAIEAISDGQAQGKIINRATGRVNAEAKAIFEVEESTSFEKYDIAILTSQNSQWAASSTELQDFGFNVVNQTWSLKEDWAEHSVWEDGGKLVITDVAEGSLAAQQIQAAFEEQFGTGTILCFIGEDDDASAGLTDAAFTGDQANQLIEQGLAGSIITNFNLDIASADGKAQQLTIGSGTGEVVNDSIGFRKLEGASSVEVNSGKTFTLIGQAVGGELIEGGAPVTLDNGTLMLGVSGVETARADSSTAGTLETVTMKNGSHIDTDNMWVQAESIKGEGFVSLTETGRMHVKELTIAGDIKNQGTLSADSLTISKGEATSSKTLKSSGKLTVESTATLSADGILAADSFDIKGVVKLGKNAQVYTGAAAMEDIRTDHADAAAELDRVEGKAEVSTMSVLDRIVAESMKTASESDEPDQEGEAVGAEPTVASLSDEVDDAPVIVTGSSKSTKVMPEQAQAFAAFDAVNRIASDIESGATPDQHCLWVNLQTNEGRFGVVKGGSSFDVDTDGAIVGAEANVMPGVKFGAALSYLDGEIEARHMKNNWESWGLHLYGAYEADVFALKGLCRLAARYDRSGERPGCRCLSCRSAC